MVELKCNLISESKTIKKKNLLCKLQNMQYLINFVLYLRTHEAVHAGLFKHCSVVITLQQGKD